MLNRIETETLLGRRGPVRAAAACTPLLAIPLLSGCLSGPEVHPADSADRTPSAALSAIDEPGPTLQRLVANDELEGNDLDRFLERSAEGLDAYFSGEFTPELGPDSAGRAAGTGADAAGPTPLVRRIVPGEIDRATLADAPETGVEATPDPAPPPPPEPIETRIALAAGELSALLASADADPVRAAVALAVVEGAMHGRDDLPAEATDLEAAFAGRLSPPELAAIAVARELARDLTTAPAESGTVSVADILRAADRAREAALSAGEGLPLSARTTRLATSVSGFGQYEAMSERPTFLAGQVNPALVYTELEGFGYRTKSPGDPSDRRITASGGGPMYQVEIAQSVELYHDADGVLAWRESRRVTRQESRRLIRDLFITNRIDLPRQLTVGAYRLKVITEDLVTGSVTEETLPLRIVADDTLAEARGRR